MNRFHRILALFLLVTLSAGILRADPSALARVDSANSGVFDEETGISVRLALSQPVPWRVFLLDAPRRLVLDLNEVVWPQEFPVKTRRVGEAATGRFAPGWSRLVMPLEEPMRIVFAVMDTAAADRGAMLTVQMEPVTEETFRALAGAPEMDWLPRDRRPRPRREPREDGRLRVVLDPGHGGIDPGAVVEEMVEAQLMLAFARQLREVLLRDGGFAVSMTRREDTFIPLETRISLARASGADVLLSLHADALPEDAGTASGAVFYTLSDEASDEASRLLAERHDKTDLLSGVDLAGQSDEIALVLLDLVRRETAPSGERLARALADGVGGATNGLNTRPLRSGAFSVLKAADFPSVLVELGFLSSEEDREKLADTAWRQRFAEGLRDGLRAWADEEIRLDARKE